MAWTVEFTQASEHDLSLIFDHLFETYKDLGETENEAFDNTIERIIGIRDSALGIATNPYRVSLREAVRILTFFFGGQDHIRQMLRRLLEK